MIPSAVKMLRKAKVLLFFWEAGGGKERQKIKDSKLQNLKLVSEANISVDALEGGYINNSSNDAFSEDHCKNDCNMRDEEIHGVQEERCTVDHLKFCGLKRQ